MIIHHTLMINATGVCFNHCKHIRKASAGHEKTFVNVKNADNPADGLRRRSSRSTHETRQLAVG
jgi:hypothetical protein